MFYDTIVTSEDMTFNKGFGFQAIIIKDFKDRFEKGSLIITDPVVSSVDIRHDTSIVQTANGVYLVIGWVNIQKNSYR